MGGGDRAWLRTSPGWSTPLGSWISGIGVEPLSQRLAQQGVPANVSTIYNWIEGRTIPSDFYADAMVRISQGTLTYEAIYTHRARIGRLPQPKGLVPRCET